MNRSVKCFAMTVAALLMLSGTSVSAQSKEDLAQKILQEVAAGRDATVLIKQYRDSHVAAGSPRLDRTAELRQLREAEQTLAEALRPLQSQAASSPDALQRAAAAYQQWKAAVLIFDGRQQAIEKKLQNSDAGSAYVARHQEVVKIQGARHQQIRQLLDTFLSDDTGVNTSNGGKVPKASGDKKGVASAATTAIALLLPKQDKTREPILHSVNLPVGAINLATRVPRTTPAVTPSYATTAEIAIVPNDNSESTEAPLSDEIIQKAKALDNDYVRIYEFVRNNNRTEWYAGSVKGASGTLRSGAGNDVDQASLLIALLRAAGVPSRYVHGVVELTLDKVANDLGLSDSSLVPGALTKAGVAFTPVARGGRIAVVQVEHTWVAARVPYTNYRGAVVDASGKTWIPLDPSYKDNKWTDAKVALSDVGTPAGFQNDYLSQVRTQTFGDFIKKRVTDFLQARSGGAVDYATQLGKQDVTALNLSLLPNSLPYPVIVVTGEDARLADSDLVQAHVVIRAGAAAGGASVLDATIPLHEISNQRFTLSYLPASLEDHRLTLSFGGLDAVPLYLIKLRPQVNVGGKVRAVATTGVEPGSDLTLEIELTGPFGSQRIAQTVMAGAYQALVLSGTAATRPAGADPADGESQAARLLDGIALAYNQAWIGGESQIAALTGVKLVRPVPSVAIVTNHMDTVYLGATPHTLVWKGVTLDAVTHPVEAIGANARDFLTLSGLHGSSLESALFQDQFSVDAISADKGLALAKTQGIGLLSLTSANVGSVDATDHAQAVKDNIKNLARLGYRIDAPATRLTDNAWTGSVWRATDDASGASGYFISGGLAGGSTTPAPDAWTLDFLADALAAPNSDPYNKDPMAGDTIFKIGAGDDQSGTVGRPLDNPFAVVVLDKEGLPVKGAQVEFKVMAGGGTVGGTTVYTATTNALGTASALMTLGQKTESNPFYIRINPNDENATRVGWNVVDVTALSARGPLTVDTPFSAIGKPDVQAALPRTSPEGTDRTSGTWVDSFGVAAVDQYGNPLPNIEVTFSISSELVCPSDNPGAYFKQGAVFDNTLKSDGGMVGCSAQVPQLGDCGAPSFSKKTNTEGGATAGVILGNDVEGNNTLNVNGGGFSVSASYKAWGYCGKTEQDRNTVPTYFGWLTSAGQTSDGQGANISAAKPGQQYKTPIAVTLQTDVYPYEVRGDKVYYYPYPSMKKTDGSVNFSVSGGGSASGTEPKGTGEFQTKVTVGAAPGTDDVTATASGIHVDIPKMVKESSSSPPVFKIVNTPLDDVSGKVATIYSVRPKIDKVLSSGDTPTPEKITLDARGRSANQLAFLYRIDPDTYKGMSVNVDLYKNGVWQDYFVGDSRKGSGQALVPRGQPFDIKDTYEVELVVNRGSTVEMKSEKFTVPTRQKLITGVAGRGAMLDVDVLNKRVCDRPGSIVFGFTQDVTAKLVLEPVDGDGKVNGSGRELFSGKSYPQGQFDYPIEAGQIGSGDFKFTLSVTGVSDPSQTDQANGGIKALFQQTNRLPVGQVMVKGVNVRDGSLVAQTQSMGVAGRGPGLHFQPTYSSGANGNIGTMGTNWTHNFDSGVHINSCGEVIVSGGDAGSVRFYPNNDGSLSPDLGYHASMIRNDADHSFDFYSKDGTRYHYSFFNPRVQWKLAFIEDTNGNILTLNYDMDAIPDPRLVNVRSSDGRELNFKYVEQAVSLPVAQNFQAFIQQVSGPGGLLMTFEHDIYGNLVSVDRNGRKEAFSYKTDDPDFSARGLLKTYTDPNGNGSGYTFNKQTVSFTPGGGGVLIVLPNSMVTEVKTPTGSVNFAVDAASFKKTKVTDEVGNGTTYNLNDYGSPLSITDPVGTTTMTWAADDVTMLSKTDARGVVTNYSYDKEGNLLTESAAGTTIQNSYLVQTAKPFIKNRLTSHTDRNGQTTGYSLDGKGNLLAEALPAGVTIQHSYSGNGDRIQTIDGNAGITRFGYDGAGNLTSTVNPVGAATSMLRDARGRVASNTDALGHATQFEYDQQDRVTARTDANGKVRSYAYDANGNKLKETDEAGRTTSWIYNALNLPIAINRADGNAKQIGYDAVGNKTSETDFRGNATTYAYDGANRLVSRSEPIGKTTSYSYDPVGNVVTEVDGLGRSTRHQYDDLNHRIGTTDAAGGAWSMGYDGNGNKTAGTDPLGRVTSFAYDGLNRLTGVVQPLGRSTSYRYDKNSNKVGEVDPNGNVTAYQYDGANRLTMVIDANGKQTNHDYDKNNNLTKTVDANLHVTLFSYDALNRKKDMKDGEGAVTSYDYDAVGNLTGETLPNSNALAHTYDQVNRRVSTVDSIGQLGSWDYDPDGNKTSETDGNGNAASHTYNALSQLTASTLPAGRNFSYDSDLMGNRTKMTDARGNATGYTYDALNRLIAVKDALGGSHQTSYDQVGNKLTETDAGGNTTSTAYDALNRPVAITDALGQTASLGYDPVGNKTRETDRRGTATAYTYDRLNRLATVTKDGVALSKNQYDDGGNLVFVTDANGNTTGYEYDKRNLRVAENRLLAAITRFKLDAIGDVVEATDPEARKTTSSYDKRRRLTAISNGAGDTTQYTYDGAGNRTATQHPGGNSSSVTYDAANRATTITDAAGSTGYAYDKAGNHVTVTDPNGNITGYSYDALNRRTGVNYPGGAHESFGYDANGNLTNHTDGNGLVVAHVYDVLNRETAKTYSASADGVTGIATQYDANNNVIQVTQSGSASQVSSYGYDHFDRQEQHTDPYGAKATTTYDANGNKTSLITQDGKVTRYSYDALNRVTSIVGQSGSIAYSYDRSSLNTGIAYGNGVASGMGYDLAKRVKTVTHVKGGSNLSRTDYEYDHNGNRSKETINRVAGAQATSYGYDSADRLTQTSVVDANKTVTTVYTLDAAGNRASEAVTTQPAAGSPVTLSKTYSYDGRNQLTAITDSSAGGTTLSYDAQGNLTQKTQGADLTLYSYNARDNLIGISKNSTVLGRYRNDHLGLRIEKEAKDPLQPNAPPVTLRTLWEGRNAFQDSDTGGTTIARYETDGRHPVSMWSRDDGVQALHHDALGSIVATTDAAGNLKSETIFDAWGNIQEEAGQSANKFGYTGHQMDKESGLIYFQARYYDPSIGRFITQDPFEGDWMTPMSLHHYLYAYANPTTYVDIDGNIAILAEAAQQLHSFSGWLRESAASCGGGAVCGVAGAAIGVSRAVAGLGEVGLRGANVLANTTSLALGTVGLNSQANIDAHAKELEGTIDATKQAYDGVSTAQGRRNTADKAFGTIDKALDGDSGAISDVTEVAAGFVGGGSAVKNAGKVALQGEKAAARAAAKGAEKADAAINDARASTAKAPATEAPPSPTAEIKTPDAQVTKEGAGIETAGENSPAMQRSAEARTVVNIKAPSILKDPSLGAAERKLIEKDFDIKVRGLQKAAKNGELNYSPDTESTRIPELQSKYRKNVIDRFERRYGEKPDISKLDADHPVDLILGGEADQALKMLHRSANRSVGSQLKKEAERLKLEPGAPIDEIRMNQE